MKANKEALTKAADILKKGGVVISPTDTVYGFLADATNKKAVEKIYKVKKRPKSKPLPIFVKDLAMAKKVAVVDEQAKKLLLTPKTTLVLKRKKIDVGRPYYLLYGILKDTVAIRIPKYKFLNDLLKKVNRPLVQTSVNLSGSPSLTKIGDIKELIGVSETPILVVGEGDLKKSKPSKIIDFTSKHLTRLR